MSCSRYPTAPGLPSGMVISDNVTYLIVVLSYRVASTFTIVWYKNESKDLSCFIGGLSHGYDGGVTGNPCNG